MTGRLALVAAPHPDDEVLGCSWVLRSRPTVVTHVTSGVALDGDRGAGRATAHRRLAEAVAAAAALRADVRERVVLGFNDQRVWRAVTQVAGELAAVVERTRPADVFVPAYQNGHPDHDATYVAALLARPSLRHPARWWAFSLYGVDPSGRYRFDHLAPPLAAGARAVRYDEQARAVKAAALRHYASQTGPGSVLGRWLTHPADEAFAPLPHARHPLPRLPCYYERAFADRCAVPADVVHRALADALGDVPTG